MGSGKSTRGRELARLLNWQFIDIDHEIVKEEKKSIQQIFLENGEKYFRKIEAAMTLKHMKQQDMVVALGGGAVLTSSVRKRLNKSSCFVIWLKVSAKVCWVRTKSSRQRPLLNLDNPLKTIKRLLRIRMPIYRNCADVVVNGDTLNHSKTLIQRVPLLKSIYLRGGE